MIRQFFMISAGFCCHPEWVTRRGGALSMKRFPALCALIEHPTRGYLLFDTGYTPSFYQETASFPFRLYRYVTPVYSEPHQTARHHLLARRIDPADIKTIIISHFHADHIGGVRDFPHARLMCTQAAYDHVRYRTGLSALRHGYLRGLIPDSMADRFSFLDVRPMCSLPSAFSPFTEGVDVYGDGLLYAVPLPGHARGQIGLAFIAPNGQPIFLIADSCWSCEAYETNTLPHSITRFVHDDWPAYQKTLFDLHTLYRQNSCLLIPSHCAKMEARLTGGCYG